MGSFKMEKNSLKDEIKKGGIFLIVLTPLIFLLFGMWSVVTLGIGLTMALAGKYASK